MSVSSEQYIGYTVTLKTDLKHEDFDFFDDFTSKHNEYDYYRGKGKVLLIVDGMSGTYARLVYIRNCIKDCWANDEDYIHLEKNNLIPDVVYDELNKPYKLMYGKDLDKDLIEYALWFHCF